jgi:putative hemolysin
MILLITGAAGTVESTVTEEEITVLLEEGTRAGVFNETEQEIVQSVFRFADRDVASIMVPRPDVVAINLDDPFETIRETIITTGHTRYPVYRNEIDQISGVISVRDLWAQTTGGGIVSLDVLVTPVLMVPESLSTIRLLEMFKSAISPLAVIVDEYGSVLGIVTLHDLMEAIVGDMDSVDITSGDPDVVEREDGSWFVDGTYPVIDLKRLLDLESLPGEEEHHYRTVAGFLMAELDRIPKTGDIIRYGGFSYEVADMDGHRIDKIIITRLQPDVETEAGTDTGESREPGSS